MGDPFPEQHLPTGEHPSTLDENVPSFFMYPFMLVSQLLSDYGWFLVIAVLVAYYFKGKAKESLSKYQSNRQAGAYHKDPDAFVAQEQALQRVRQKQQEKYEREAQERKEKLRQEQEIKANKRQELLEKALSKDKSKEKDSKSFRPEFNPLMAGGPSAIYRPARRSTRGGG